MTVRVAREPAMAAGVRWMVPEFAGSIGVSPARWLTMRRGMTDNGRRDDPGLAWIQRFAE